MTDCVLNMCHLVWWLAFLVMDFPSFAVRAVKKGTLARCTMVFWGKRGDGYPPHLLTISWPFQSLRCFYCCLFSSEKVSQAHTVLTSFKLLLRQRLVYLKVLRVCGVTPSWLIIYEKWDIFWNNTKLAKHGSSIIQSRKTAVLKYILSCWDFSCLFSFNENNILWKEMNTESVLVTCWWRQSGSSQISSRWRNYGFL